MVRWSPHGVGFPRIGARAGAIRSQEHPDLLGFETHPNCIELSAFSLFLS